MTGVSVLALACSYSGAGLAQDLDIVFDYVVDADTFELNGDEDLHLLDGDKSLKVTSGGSIQVDALDLSSAAVASTGTGNVVYNQGLISSSKGSEIASSYGVDLFDIGNHLVNEGRITVTRVASGAAVSLDANGARIGTSLNSGDIDVSAIANTTGGTAFTSGTGLLALGSAVNTGRIQVSLEATSDADAVSNLFGGIFSDGQVVNSGEIFVSSVASASGNAFAAAWGINADGDIRNSGKVTVRASAEGATASAYAFALVANGNENDIYLEAPSYLGGIIDTTLTGNEFAGNNNRVTITTGASHSILWDLQNIDTSLLTIEDDLVPAFLVANDTKIATFDPTVFAARSSALADRAGEVGGVMRARRDAAGDDGCSTGGSGADLAPYAYEEPGGCTAKAGSAAWVAAFGRVMDYDGGDATVDHTTETYGGAGGFDWVGDNGLILGAMVGYGGETLDASSRWSQSYDNDANGFFAGAYSRAGAGPVLIDIEVAGGYLDHDDSRLVNDNLAQDSTGFFDGVSWRDASYDSWWASVGAAVSADITMGAWTLTPRVGGFYAYEWIDGYSESGGAFGATVGAQNVGVAEGHIELALSRMVMANALFTGRGGYFARASSGDDHVAVTIDGTTEQVPTYADDASGFYAGTQVVVDRPGSAVFEIGGNAFFGDDVSGYQGTASLSTQF